MVTLHRVLDAAPVTSADSYVANGGGAGLAATVAATREEVIAALDSAGLRGRGGAGFPTGRKWRTIADHESPAMPTTVVVNAAEGEPGSFKDRWLIRTNPYRVLEGALIAATAMDARDIVVAIKSSFTTEAERLRAATEELRALGWLDDLRVEVFEGPAHYLYGEETGLLEALDGRPPFPRVTPPWRRGIVEVELPSARVDGEVSGATADLELASETDASPVPPALVNNAETLAHVTTILANGADWFRQLGTANSPGSLLCTVTGSTRRHAVAEVAMGTPLIDVLDEVGGGPIEGRAFTAVLSGVANPLLSSHDLTTPLTYEDMRAAGNGLGAAGFIVFDDHDDLLAVMASAQRFLAVESCGQCSPCKGDGLAMDHLLATATTEGLSEHEWSVFEDLRETVTVGARCSLAQQQVHVTQGARRVSRRRPADGRTTVIAPIVDIADGLAHLDPHQDDKQPDWSYDQADSAQYPAETLG